MNSGKVSGLISTNTVTSPRSQWAQHSRSNSQILAAANKMQPAFLAGAPGWLLRTHSKHVVWSCEVLTVFFSPRSQWKLFKVPSSSEDQAHKKCYCLETELR